MNLGYRKYRPFEPLSFPERTWPDKAITKAPAWCSVDLRDGNQALINPMNLEQKLEFFQLLCDIGFKEIEVGFPSASETEYEILRALIDQDLIPEDVTIQVLVQAREHLIRKTFEAIDGAKNVIVHFYNSTSTLQRRVVFNTDMQGVIDIAVNGARLIRKLTEEITANSDINIRYEYSPESFSGTEMDNAVLICDRVLEELGATPENRVIINLPNTVEMCTPNTYADQIEYCCRNMKHRDSAIISLHPHNDRGTATAATELGIMAGAERVEGTIFGNGERTGNSDIMNLAMNMYSQGVDPKLDFSHMNHIKEVYERCTELKVHPRHPYAGKLVFTAFSGSHQDAINKGVNAMQKENNPYWEVPYLPIDPADLGRQYEPIVRINSQSGKGGAAFVMHQSFGYVLPKAMHPEFGRLVKKDCDEKGREISAQEVFDIFNREYLDVHEPYDLISYKIFEENGGDGKVIVDFEGTIRHDHVTKDISGKGNGPIDAFFNAIKAVGLEHYEFVSYSEHAISSGADSKAVSYIELKHGDERLFGVGVDSNISIASIKGIICAINRNLRV
ncbi:2-isopropylmalate synthase [Acutalibacter muris]|uniref:2-isopropylmalate synthase n=1 Tax=Acutalibacter muris TaxID=1796620 RepID=A0A1Z2XLZ2_9FIRM|nr:2-isopropylmalate synthase [Acutalibacter muris]ANU53863.1 2-isopropylmalate synthase [Hungateiclostridiaceae bacterium KB18]ASB39460.1 2-isopropylmalate synthase [Acutalibacter muris]QQR28751.1 2-isopropylmalate synthase [Acutalibacter muris]